MGGWFQDSGVFRASDIDGKTEEFWRQGDFGYVKKELDSMMVLCKPKEKVLVTHTPYQQNASSSPLFP